MKIFHSRTLRVYPQGGGILEPSNLRVFKNWQVRSTFGRSDVVLRGRRKGLCTLSKVRKKCVGVLAFPKTMAGVGHLKRIWTDAFSVAGAVQETCSSDMLGSQGADFLRGVAFWSIKSSVSGKWFCVTGAALCMTWHHFIVAGAILQRHGLEKLQNALVRGRQLCIQFSYYYCYYCYYYYYHYYYYYTTTILLLLPPQLQQQYQLYRMTQHGANYTAAHYDYKCKCNQMQLQLLYITQQYTTLH